MRPDQVESWFVSGSFVKFILREKLERLETKLETRLVKFEASIEAKLERILEVRRCNGLQLQSDSH